MKCLFSRLTIATSGALVALALGAALTPAMASADTSQCTTPPLSQPFTALRDYNWYTLAPGQAVDDFVGNGWTLSGGAGLPSTTLADGRKGQVLNLPSGSEAVSPIMCVGVDYPTARTYVRNVVGAEGVQFYVSYQNANGSWTRPQDTGQFHGGSGAGWGVSNRINLDPPKTSGWELVRFTLVPSGKSSDFQVSNFYVDPRMRH
jgi:hypothetical protein